MSTFFVPSLSATLSCYNIALMCLYYILLVPSLFLFLAALVQSLFFCSANCSLASFPLMSFYSLVDSSPLEISTYYYAYSTFSHVLVVYILRWFNTVVWLLANTEYLFLVSDRVPIVTLLTSFWGTCRYLGSLHLHAHDVGKLMHMSCRNVVTSRFFFTASTQSTYNSYFTF
jgi:hypothetical protein